MALEIENVPATLDLAPLVTLAMQCGILGRRETGILMQLNNDANEAKHDLIFQSRGTSGTMWLSLRLRLLDRDVEDPLFEERMHRIQTQLTSALALRQILFELEIENVPATLDLAPLVTLAMQYGILGRRETGILMQLNNDANEAKHDLIFQSRL